MMQRTSTGVLLILAAFALLLVPVAAIAVGGFTDVDSNNVFKADIAWLAAAGITKGCNPPTNTEFCPDGKVTREEMAAFMHRLAVNKVVAAKTATDADKLDGKDSTAFAASGHDHDADYLAVNGKAADADKLDGFSVEDITPRASGVEYFRQATDPEGVAATVTIDAPARGIIIAYAGGDSYSGTGIQRCVLQLDSVAFPGVAGEIDHRQGQEDDCIVSSSVVVDAGVHTVALYLAGDAYHWGNLWALWIPFDGIGAVPALTQSLASTQLKEKHRK